MDCYQNFTDFVRLEKIHQLKASRTQILMSLENELYIGHIVTKH